MWWKIRLAATLFILIFLRCTSIRVNYDYDPAVDFSKYKSYSLESSKDVNDLLARNPLLLKRIYNAIDSTMRKKGFVKIDSLADFIIFPHGSTKDKTEIRDWSGYAGWWNTAPYGPGGGGRIDIRQYTEGTIIVDMVDAEKKQVFWRGFVKGEVGSASSPQESAKNINDLIAGILKNFPPDVSRSK